MVSWKIAGSLGVDSDTYRDMANSVARTLEMAQVEVSYRQLISANSTYRDFRKAMREIKQQARSKCHK